MHWVDRLGRNYRDVTDTIREFMRRGASADRRRRHGFGGATKDPMPQAVRDALIAFMAATAQAQAEATKEAQKAGILHAQESERGTNSEAASRARLGDLCRRPTATEPGIAVTEIAKTTGLNRQSIYRNSKRT